jgi:hypothetical protein
MLAFAAFSFVSIAGRPLGGPPPAEQAGQHDATTHSTASGDHTMTGGQMMMNGQMAADMKAADAKLDQLVADMNGAKGDAKVAAIARVVTELVNHQKAMHAHMNAMHQNMMSSKK